MKLLGSARFVFSVETQPNLGLKFTVIISAEIINLIMIVAAMHDKAWLAVGVNDKKRTELLLFSKKLEKACDTF